MERSLMDKDRLRKAIVEGLWDARDSGEEVSELQTFIERDADIILKHVLNAITLKHD